MDAAQPQGEIKSDGVEADDTTGGSPVNDTRPVGYLAFADTLDRSDFFFFFLTPFPSVSRSLWTLLWINQHLLCKPT